MKSQGLKEERLMLLEGWRDAEQAAVTAVENGNNNSSSSSSNSSSNRREHLEAVEAKFPRKIKMRRPVLAEDGITSLGTEEYFDYIFPDDEKKMGTICFKLCTCSAFSICVCDVVVVVVVVVVLSLIFVLLYFCAVDFIVGMKILEKAMAWKTAAANAANAAAANSLLATGLNTGGGGEVNIDDDEEEQEQEQEGGGSASNGDGDSADNTHRHKDQANDEMDSDGGEDEGAAVQETSDGSSPSALGKRKNESDN
jgi:hypothetical protein